MTYFYPPNGEAIKAVMRSKGYVVFGNARGYDLNLFGIRTLDTVSNAFNDWVGCMYLMHGVWNLFPFPATTDPGLYWRSHPMNVKGTAVLKPGQYRGVYRLGEHKGYPALVQRGAVVVYRDPDRDSYLDLDDDSTDEGVFGINIHRASKRSPSIEVNKWSAGCQVIQDAVHHEFHLELVRKSIAIYGHGHTYTLLTEADFA